MNFSEQKIIQVWCVRRRVCICVQVEALATLLKLNKSEKFRKPIPETGGSYQRPGNKCKLSVRQNDISIRRESCSCFSFILNRPDKATLYDSESLHCFLSSPSAERSNVVIQNLNTMKLRPILILKGTDKCSTKEQKNIGYHILWYPVFQFSK